MMSAEKIPFPTDERPQQFLRAYLLESRSIGGLSGSPVFIRETIEFNAVRQPNGSLLVGVSSPILDTIIVRSLGRFHFFGSMIGHWSVDVGFNDTRVEAVNFGITPMVPAHKILEILG